MSVLARLVQVMSGFELRSYYYVRPVEKKLGYFRPAYATLGLIRTC